MGTRRSTRVLDERSELSFHRRRSTAARGTCPACSPARAVCGEGDGTPTPAAYSGRIASTASTRSTPPRGAQPARHGDDAVPASVRRRTGTSTPAPTRCTRTSSSSRTTASPPRSNPTGSSTAPRSSRMTPARRSGVDVRLTNRDVARRDADAHHVRACRSATTTSRRSSTAPRRASVSTASTPTSRARSTTATRTRRRPESSSKKRRGPPRWLRFVLGARGDRVDAATNNESQTAVDQVLGLQRAGAVLAEGNRRRDPPRRSWTSSPTTGAAFTRNDARTLFLGQATTLHRRGDGLRGWGDATARSRASRSRRSASSSTSRPS